MDKTATFNVEVVSKQITGISVKTKPTKLSYIQNYENLDLTGGVIEVSYNDNSKSNVNMTNSGVTPSGFSNATTGSKTITLTYMGKTATFNVEVVSKQITGISIEENPTKLNYIQNYENLDLTGGVIKAIYNDESTTLISMSNEDVTVEGFNNENLGEITLTVKYLEEECTFKVKIISKSIEKIEVKQTPLKSKYLLNKENLDLTGGIIVITYNDETTDEIAMTNESIEISGFNKNQVGSQTVTLKYFGKETTVDLEVYVDQEATTVNDKAPDTGVNTYSIFIFVILLSILTIIYLRFKNRSKFLNQ